MTVQVYWLGEPASQRAERVGGKAASLSRLARRYPVPAGFCVVGSAPGELDEESADETIATAYRQLAESAAGAGQAVAVRSSALDEDGADASFAGLNETYLNVVGESAVLDAVRRCVASFGSPRALDYRSRHGLEAAPEHFAVLVQQLVFPDVAGVAFSIDPISGDRSTVVVNASWGLGESVVGGTVTPDSYRIDRSQWTVTHHEIGDKTRMTVPTRTGAAEVTVPRKLRLARALDDEGAVRTARLAAELEAEMAGPTDIEFAWSNGHLHLLQCRPVTALGIAHDPVRAEKQPPQHAVTRPDSEFPVRWEHPADAELAWQLHRNQHDRGGQVTPLEFDLAVRWQLEGIGYACAEFGRPVTGARAMLVNTYPYFATLAAPVDADEALRQHLGSDAVIEQRAVDLEQDWQQRYLSRITQLLRTMEPATLTALSDAELASHLEAMQEHVAELWRIHFLVDFPSHVAITEFENLYRDLFPDHDAFAASRLLGGVQNRTLEGNQELWRLSREVMREPLLRHIFAETGSADIPPALEQSPQGRAFLTQLRTYLNVHGRRADDISLRMTSWAEDPTPALEGLKTYAQQAESSAPTEMQQRSLKDAHRGIDDARTVLAHYPRPVAALFEELLPAARTGTRLSEDHAFYIDYGATYVVRQVALEAGRRLTARGALADRESVFLLHLGELARALRDPQAPCRKLVEHRAGELEQFATVDPPASLGAGPVPPPPAEGWMERLQAGYEGTGSAGADTALSGTLTGSPGSPGRVHGTARVLASVTEADRLQPGDILVTEATMSTWTPLFANAAAVVTNVGGVLSHSAVVAREYGIPAVVGAAGATTIIGDGQIIEVDGDTGTVRLGLAEQASLQP